MIVRYRLEEALLIMLRKNRHVDVAHNPRLLHSHFHKRLQNEKQKKALS